VVELQVATLTEHVARLHLNFRVEFSMGKESFFPSWESLTTTIDLIVFYLNGLDL
jgi:hypothetical protein